MRPQKVRSNRRSLNVLPTLGCHSAPFEPIYGLFGAPSTQTGRSQPLRAPKPLSFSLRNPGIEPGSPAWQASIIPLDQLRSEWVATTAEKPDSFYLFLVGWGGVGEEKYREPGRSAVA